MSMYYIWVLKELRCKHCIKVYTQHVVPKVNSYKYTMTWVLDLREVYILTLLHASIFDNVWDLICIRVTKFFTFMMRIIIIIGPFFTSTLVPITSKCISRQGPKIWLLCKLPR